MASIHNNSHVTNAASSAFSLQYSLFNHHLISRIEFWQQIKIKGVFTYWSQSELIFTSFEDDRMFAQKSVDSNALALRA